MSRLLLATTNVGKQREFARLLGEISGSVVTPQQMGLDLDVPEPHDSYAENASVKAVAYCRASGLPALADDSGIEVAALEWGPGVLSARFGRTGGDPDQLLEAVGEAPDRRARMVCWLALAIPGYGPDGTPRAPRVELFSGVVEGTLASERHGAGGFGYDPVFLLPSGVTTAELPEAEKDAISHRGRAVAAALPRLRALLAESAVPRGHG
ncbi:MAG TPA: non-canonical purine NTP pyrophosphatase [Candidatus Limnocylindria bacterium]|nr:non-canonical purine NTP pyrophosphatase [Candidatus Limnocylindria bacterium]